MVKKPIQLIYFQLIIICFLIYPSLNESLGMPLVEAVLSKCKVIASDLNYVDQVIIPSLKFTLLFFEIA